MSPCVIIRPETMTGRLPRAAMMAEYLPAVRRDTAAGLCQKHNAAVSHRQATKIMAMGKCVVPPCTSAQKFASMGQPLSASVESTMASGVAVST